MLKKVLLALGILGLFGAYYGYTEYNRKPADLSALKADVEVTPLSIVDEFTTDEEKANAKYLNKTVAVAGKIINIEKDDKGLPTVYLGADDAMFNVSCEMDANHAKDAVNLKVGEMVKLKGKCTGFGSDVVLIRSVVEK